MKNFIALIFIFVLGMQMAFAETLPPKGYYDVKPEDYPILFGYVEDYANKLFEDYNPSIFWAPRVGPEDIYYINKDGSITEFFDEHKTDKRLKKLILSISPSPFPKELEAEKIKIHLILFKENFNKINIYYFASRETFWITLYKPYQRKSWFKKKK